VSGRVERRPRRALRYLIGFVAFLLVAWLVLCFLVVQHPTINRVTHADAVVVLGPPDNYRLSAAERLVAEGVADQLLISVPATGFGRAVQLCAHPPAGVRATCFKPDPGTTRGEAEATRRMAHTQGWTTVVVVTSKFHVSRARMIFDRCLDGTVETVSAHQSISPAQWAYQYVYQSAGYVRAFLQGGC
jgi:uncharacterized SAM-binding protein YcdF (DUF218 family)